MYNCILYIKFPSHILYGFKITYFYRTNIILSLFRAHDQNQNSKQTSDVEN